MILRGSLSHTHKLSIDVVSGMIVQQLYSLGARKIGVTTLPPLGCLPASITLFGDGSNQCLPSMNVAALSFNNKLNMTSLRLQNKLTGLNLVILDIYQSLYDLVTKPADFGTSKTDSS